MIEAVSAALSREEQRCGFVTREVSLLLQLMDVQGRSRGGPGPEDNHPPTQSSTCSSPMGGAAADLSSLSAVPSQELGEEDAPSGRAHHALLCDAQNCLQEVEAAAGISQASTVCTTLAGL